jgi:hypothetical protein
MRAVHWSIALMCALPLACGSSGSGTAAADPTPAGAALVIRGAELPAGTLLSGLRGRVPGILIRTDAGACPSITFRGQRSALRQGNPSVYIDGTLMSDTCILTGIQAADVDFVEVYTSGAGAQRDAQSNPFGAIFVYRVRQ